MARMGALAHKGWRGTYLLLDMSRWEYGAGTLIKCWGLFLYNVGGVSKYGLVIGWDTIAPFLGAWHFRIEQSVNFNHMSRCKRGDYNISSGVVL